MKIEPQTPEPFSDSDIRMKIKQMVINQFGNDHRIKVVIFKPNPEYNDQGYDYNSPLLIAIDDRFYEYDMKNVCFLVPDEEEQGEYYEKHNEDLYLNNLTIRFE